ncbi:MAG: SIMPL domain-containing protein [Bacteroidota bacterium]
MSPISNMKVKLNSALIAIAIVTTALILGDAFTNRNKRNNTISVTGLGSKSFTSDLIVWSGEFVRKSLVLREAYSQLDQDREAIRKYLLGKGLKADNLVFSAVEIAKEFDEQYDDNGNRIRSIFTGYKLTQRAQVESSDVDKVENISRTITELINAGIEFYSSSPEYYYTKLAELKVEMIAAATKDASIRAQKIAENAGSSVGKLKNAEMGVFQIVAENSSEDFSWGGSFNTSSKRKTANITVRLDYEAD